MKLRQGMRRISATALLAVAMELTLASQTPSVAASTSDQQEVIQQTIAAVQARFPKSTATPTVIQIAIVDTYALATWLDGEGGGQAVLSKSSKGWTVIGIHGGGIQPAILVTYGVPSTTATSLWTNLGPVPTPTP